MEVGSLAAGYDGSIRINTKLDRNGFNQGLNAIAGSLKKLGGAMGVAFGVTAMVKFGKEALNIASDLTEVQTSWRPPSARCPHRLTPGQKTPSNSLA